MKTIINAWYNWRLSMINKYLAEQAISRKDAESGVSHLSEIVIEHLIKVLMYGPKCSAYNHWINELDSWFFKIANIKLKPKSYSLSLKDLRKWIREESLNAEAYYNYITNIQNRENEFDAIGKDLLLTHFKEFNSLFDSILSTCCNKPRYTKKLLCDIIETWFNNYSETYK